MTSGGTVTAATTGVAAELGAIEERRAYAIALWDGQIQQAWASLLWYQEQAYRLAERVTAGTSSHESAAAWVRCMDAINTLTQHISALEAEARAQVRGMDQFIAWAKQGSRIDAYLADQFRLQRAGMTLEEVA